MLYTEFLLLHMLSTRSPACIIRLNCGCINSVNNFPKNIFVTFITANTAVLILARGGSKGIRLKNLRTVASESLVCRAIRIAKTAGYYDVTVSTDHPLIALESIKCKSTVFKRSYITATDWAPSIWGVAEFLSTRPDVTTVVLLQATSPFTYPEKIREAAFKLNHPISYDCVFSVARSFKLRWKQENGILYPINFNIQNRPRRQDLAGELIETGAFYITRKELIFKGYFQNSNCTVVIDSPLNNLEIDSEHDLKVANALLSYDLV